MAWGRLWIEVFAVRYYPDSCLVGWGKILENVAQDSHVFWSRFELGVTVTRSISFVNGSNIWFVFCTRQLFTDSILIIRVGNPESWETSFWAACDTSQCKFHVMFVCTKHSFPSGLTLVPHAGNLDEDRRKLVQAMTVFDPSCVQLLAKMTIFMLDWTIQYSTRPGYIWMYRGADKSLARPRGKQARKHIRDSRDFNDIETRAVIKFFFLPPCKARRRRKFTPLWQKH